MFKHGQTGDIKPASSITENEILTVESRYYAVQKRR